MKSLHTFIFFMFFLLVNTSSSLGGMIFTKVESQISKDGIQIMNKKTKMFFSDDKVRLEGVYGSTIWGTGTYIIDLKEKKKIEIMNAKARSVMEKDLSQIDIDWIEKERKIASGIYLEPNQTKEKIREETVNGHPMAVYELTKKTIVKIETKVGRRKKITEQEVVTKSYVWEALDYNNFPIRFEYPMDNGGKLIVEYIDIETNVDIDPKMFQKPEGYVEFGYF